jgi:hypothetical protein
MKRLVLLAILLVTACADPNGPVGVAVLHVGNYSSEAVAVSYQLSGPTWFTAGDVPAHGGRCLTLPFDGPITLRARGVTTGATVADSGDFSLSRDWRWDVDVSAGLAALDPIPTGCG